MVATQVGQRNAGQKRFFLGSSPDTCDRKQSAHNQYNLRRIAVMRSRVLPCLHGVLISEVRNGAGLVVKLQVR